MQVKFLTGIVDAVAGVAFKPKQEATLDDELAAKWIRTGICASNETVPVAELEAQDEIAQIVEIVKKAPRKKS
jgi:hypothetical protein